MKYGITEQLHPDTADLVLRVSVALAAKLLAAQKKYGYTNGWKRSDWDQACRRELVAHVIKGDPLDVMAFAAFCWHHGWSTSPRETAAADAKGVAQVDQRIHQISEKHGLDDAGVAPTVVYADKIAFESAIKAGKGCDVWSSAGDYTARTGRELIALQVVPAGVEGRNNG